MSFIPPRPPGGSSFGSRPPSANPPSSAFGVRPPLAQNNRPSTLNANPPLTFKDRQNLRYDSRINHLAQQERRLAKASTMVDESLRANFEAKRQSVTAAMNRLQNLQKSEE